jgi:hypothetical protein
MVAGRVFRAIYGSGPGSGIRVGHEETMTGVTPVERRQ